MFSTLQLRRFVCLLTLTLALIKVPKVLALNTTEKLGQYGRQSWQTETGLPQNSIHAILQTRDGYIWFGTEGGLVRFDGLRFTVYETQNTPELGSNNVRSLFEDRGGALWVGTSAGVARYAHAKFHGFTALDGLPAGSSWLLGSGSVGSVWAVSAGGWASFSGDKVVRRSADQSISDPRVLAADESGRLWLGTRNGIESIDGSRGSLSTETNENVTAILFENSSIWIGTDHGLQLMNHGKIVKIYKAIDNLPSDRITCLTRDRDGAIWVGTDAGVARIVEGQVETFPSSEPLSRDSILSTFEDREGNIWIGTDSNGVTVLRDQKFRTYFFRSDQGHDQIRCVFEDRHGAVWIGTDGDGLKRFANGQLSSFTTNDGLSSNVILALAQDAEGSLLVGTPDGLNRLHNNAVSLITSSDGLAEDFVRSLYPDRDGSVWVGTRRGLSHVSGGRVIATYTQSNGLGSDTVGAMARDTRNDLWIGTLRGLTRMHGESFTNYTVADGLSSNVITDLYLDGEGSLWIATQDGGLNRFRDDVFTRYPAALGLPKTIYGITEDANGSFWLAAKSGIFRVSKAELKRYAAQGRGTIAVVAYGTSDGLRVSECSGGGHPAVWKDRSGNIWFATAKGAALLPSGHTVLNRVPPPAVLESVYIDDDMYDPAAVTVVTPGHARLAFEYAGLSFVAPQKVQFKYKLEGFDRSWIDAGTRRVAYYTNLPPRSYRFRVIARNNDGFWSESGASFPISIQPHYYQTWWFDVLLFALLSLAVYAIFAWRVQQVQARFNAVLGERNRIAREIHDTLAQGFAGMSVQLELVSRLWSSSSEAAREHLDQARLLVRSSLSDARQSIWELRSQSAEQQDFAGRFSKLARQMSESSTAKVQLEVHGTYRPLGFKVEDELFRIGQEAVTNAVRHAGAQNISINLTFDTRKLRMTVADDGKGFSGEVNSYGPEGHFGLKGMRERADQINAQLTIDSGLGSGTRISVEAPAR